jgi:hypothetical protein
MGWRLEAIAPPLIICPHAQTKDQILAPTTIASIDHELRNDLGATMAAILTLGLF